MVTVIAPPFDVVAGRGARRRARLPRMSSPSVSVVVAAHNPVHLHETLRSIADQDLDTLDIVVVDDGSEPPIDVTGDVSTPIRVIRHETPQERAAARMTGLLAATGDWVMVVDHDDLLAIGSINVLLDVAVATRCDAVFGREVKVEADARAPFLPRAPRRLRTRPARWWDVFCSSDHFGMVLAKTATARDIGFSADFVPADDYLYAIELCAKARAVRVDQTVRAWRQHRDQTTQTSQEAVQAAVDRVRRHVLSEYSPRGIVGRRVRSYIALRSDAYGSWKAGDAADFRRAVVRAVVDWPPVLVTKEGWRAVAAAARSLLP
jgi:glycosyltransferase involved in cell wall biosynthesis